MLFLLGGLLFAALATTYFLVSRANQRNALKHSESNLEIGARVFDDAVAQRVDYLERTAGVMTGDYAIRQVLKAETPDADTLSSNLKSYTERVQAPVIALFDPQGVLLANSDKAMSNENQGPFAYLIRRATEQSKEQESGFAYLNKQLHVLVVVPLYAPYPEMIAWFGLAFPIDRTFATKIKETTQLEVTFVDQSESRVLTSTLDAGMSKTVAAAVPAKLAATTQLGILDLSGDRYVTLFKAQEMLGDDPITVVLQRPLSSELAAAKKLESSILGISLAALGIAALAAAWIARGVSQPVQALAAHTQHVAAGDYTQRIDLQRDDELGQLSTAFNQMTAGLAERDRVRDLLGKVVSPEIATQLLQSDLKLGGEEREVTILFSDIRDFTTLSEKLAPTELLALLNRYLDRMSTIVEKHGGVIDKYIGDAIMALFGAPVSAADSADRAIAAAREMAAALATLNLELAAEGKPPLMFGIGINTARVIAGNMGSKTRLNYTVIGDGVNLASRLEGLTKDPVYGTRIIISEATVLAARSAPAARELGEVKVKGKAQAVKIFALGAKGESQPPYPG